MQLRLQNINPYHRCRC